MPKMKIEVRRTVTITRDESAVIELDVPPEVRDEGEVDDWLDSIMERSYEKLSDQEKVVHTAVGAAEWDVSNEDEEHEYVEITVEEGEL